MPIGIKAVRSALEGGDVIMVTTISEPESKAGTFYALRGAGRTIPRNTFAKISADLIPLDKGLFDDAPQTYGLKGQA